MDQFQVLSKLQSLTLGYNELKGSIANYLYLARLSELNWAAFWINHCVLRQTHYSKETLTGSNELTYIHDTLTYNRIFLRDLFHLRLEN
ncbi:hypothetical protein CUMW_136280 [Citrus unshiu]|nr:hypothetical protein CUMW_136280 [Citrus unshiu]